MVSLITTFVMGAATAPIRLERTYSKQELPIERISGVAVTGNKWVVGGIRGLYQGVPGGKWTKVSDQAIRQMAKVKDNTWVLHGNGAVDKLDVGRDQFYSDALLGAVKRPWVGSMSVVNDRLMFGGSGGWIEKVGDKSLTESYPSELEKLTVTTMAVVGTEKLAGTQDGLFVFGSGKVKRLGFGQGLSDVWITSIASFGEGAYVGTYTGGHYLYSRGSLKKLDGPSAKVRCLSIWQDRLVLGALDGCWIATKESWAPLTTGETTFISSVDGKLMVGNTEAVSVFK